MERLKSQNESRFVFIVSFPRSGTTALGSILQQPGTQIHYHGEFFGVNDWKAMSTKISHHYPSLILKYIIGFLLQKQKWRPYLFESLRLDPDKALRALAKVSGIHVFKIFPTHIYDKSLEALIGKFRPDILFIRRNHLDRLVSLKKALATQIWHGRPTESVEVEINQRELNDYIFGYENFYQRTYLCAETFKVKILDVDYESLFASDKIEEALNFILANSKTASFLETRPKTLKQDSSDSSQQNFLRSTSQNEVRRTIADYNFRPIGN